MKQQYVIYNKTKDGYFSRQLPRGNTKWAESMEWAYSYDSIEEAENIKTFAQREFPNDELIVEPYHKQLGKIMTITANNYFAEADKFISKLPGPAKEAHELVLSLKKDGIDNPFNTGDADIDEVGAKLLEQANKVLNDSATPSAPKAAKKSVKSVAKKSASDKPVQTSPTTSNKKQGLKSKSYRATSNKSNSFKQKSKPATKKTMPVKKAKKMARKTAAKAVKQARKSDAKKAPVTIKKLSLELQIIKQVAGMAGKTYTVQAIEKKRTTIGNHLKEGRIHDHVTLIKQLHTGLGKMIEAANKAGAGNIKASFSRGKKDELLALVKDAKVRVRTEFLAGAENAKNSAKRTPQKKSEAYTEFTDPGYIVREDGMYFVPEDQRASSTTGTWSNELTHKSHMDWHRASKVAKYLSMQKGNEKHTFIVKEFHAKKA